LLDEAIIEFLLEPPDLVTNELEIEKYSALALTI
jgi:hypothetical protein